MLPVAGLEVPEFAPVFVFAPVLELGLELEAPVPEVPLDGTKGMGAQRLRYDDSPHEYELSSSANILNTGRY